MVYFRWLLYNCSIDLLLLHYYFKNGVGRNDQMASVLRQFCFAPVQKLCVSEPKNSCGNIAVFGPKCKIQDIGFRAIRVLRFRVILSVWVCSHECYYIRSSPARLQEAWTQKEWFCLGTRTLVARYVLAHPNLSVLSLYIMAIHRAYKHNHKPTLFDPAQCQPQQPIHTTSTKQTKQIFPKHDHKITSHPPSKIKSFSARNFLDPWELALN